MNDNWDRHNGNWGFLYDTQKDTLELAPVYDCGSSLYPQADDEMMKTILSNKNEMNYRIFDIPTSAIQINNKKINYFRFLSLLENEECNYALRHMMPRIDMEKIEGIVEQTPIISDLQKTFYKTMLRARKEWIRSVFDWSDDIAYYLEGLC